MFKYLSLEVFLVAIKQSAHLRFLFLLADDCLIQYKDAVKNGHIPAAGHALPKLDDDKRHVVSVRPVSPCCHTIENGLLHLLKGSL